MATAPLKGGGGGGGGGGCKLFGQLPPPPPPPAMVQYTEEVLLHQVVQQLRKDCLFSIFHNIQLGRFNCYTCVICAAAMCVRLSRNCRVHYLTASS